MKGNITIDGFFALDLLQAAWNLTDEEFASVLNVPPTWLSSRRNHECRDIDLFHIERLLTFHRSLMLVSEPGRYGEYLKREWSADSAIGQKSILDVISETGRDAAMEMLQSHFWSA